MRPNVRRAEAADLDGVLALYRELRPNDPILPDAEAKTAFDRLLQRDDVAIIVCQGERLLTATCMLAVVPNLASGTRPFGIIEHVVTLPQFRRCGYAKAVLEQALELAWSKGCYKVVLLSGAERKGAHKLYESVGFRGDIEVGFVAKPA
jgi:GNAT superfamily N-acetyltransferase